MRVDLCSQELLASDHFSRAALAVVIMVCLGLFLTNISTLPITDPDESRCVVIVQNMITSGNWLMPYFDGKIYFDKPAPFFWMSAFVQTISGSMEAGGRVIAAIAGLGAVLITFFFTRRIAGAFAALIAGVILATSPEFLFIARWYRMDMPFVCFMWGALWWFWRYEPIEHKTKQQRRACWWGFYVWCGFAAMVKGPAGLVLPVLILLVYFVVKGQYRRVFEAISISGFLLFFAIASPWYIAACMREPGYAYQFFIEQNFVRYAGHSLGHFNVPGVVYVAIMIGGIVPWAILFPATVEKMFPRKWKLRNQNPETLFLWTVILFTLVFFGVAKTKMPNYIAPVFAPLSMLIAIPISKWAMSKEYDKPYRHAMLVLCAVLILLPVAIVAAQVYLKWPNMRATFIALAAFICAGGMARSITRDARPQIILYACASVVLVFGAAIVGLFPQLYEEISYRPLAYTIRDRIGPDDTIIYMPARRATFTIYAGLTTDKKIMPGDPNCQRKIATAIANSGNVYFLVKGDTALETLRKYATKPLHTVSMRDDSYVVTTAEQLRDEVKKIPSLRTFRIGGKNENDDSGS